jgi:hypothetical protein
LPDDHNGLMYMLQPASYINLWVDTFAVRLSIDILSHRFLRLAVLELESCDSPLLNVILDEPSDGRDIVYLVARVCLHRSVFLQGIIRNSALAALSEPIILSGKESVCYLHLLQSDSNHSYRYLSASSFFKLVTL